MLSFGGDAVIISQVPSDVVRALATTDRGRGQEALHLAQLPGLLDQLALRARVQSVKASSALEGVVVPDDRRADRIITRPATALRTRNESELAGYRDALDYLWQHDGQPLNVGLCLHLHRLLLHRTSAAGGTLKTAKGAMLDGLVDQYLHQRERDAHHPVLLVGLAVLDFLVIHPFDVGNGRVARVLTSALLQESGYGVARYVSLEQLIADTSEDYYATLLASTHGWHDGEHDPRPWLRYFVATVSRAYELFAQRTVAAQEGGGKRDRVKRYVVEQAPRTFSIGDVRSALPGVSDGTIRNALHDLRREGHVDSDGPGRSATWTRRAGSQ